MGERNRVHLVALSTDEERGIPIDDRRAGSGGAPETAGLSRRPPVGDDRFEVDPSLRLRRRVRRVSPRLGAARPVPLRFFGFPGEDAQDPLSRRGEPLDEPRVHDVPGIRVRQGSGAERCRLPVSPVPRFRDRRFGVHVQPVVFPAGGAPVPEADRRQPGGAPGRQLRGGDEGQSQGCGLPPVRTDRRHAAVRLRQGIPGSHDRGEIRPHEREPRPVPRDGDLLRGGGRLPSERDAGGRLGDVFLSGFPGVDPAGIADRRTSFRAASERGRRLLPRRGSAGDLVVSPGGGGGGFLHVYGYRNKGCLSGDRGHHEQDPGNPATTWDGVPDVLALSTPAGARSTGGSRATSSSSGPRTFSPDAGPGTRS